ncbi:hypothetical protein GCM10017044_10950 [Kordiimonas sediminis]|uniref:Uncharacterized protein n=1 Tax=Kordiimonas sediminis TaxID=1735581 RepID=A0A919E497_9PROT|nr:hypothetical protein [Kordiimonas sediminis]GHF18248.1 hypothetical protein GCM10017044_10950 [Kordiimonas sediminis]
MTTDTIVSTTVQNALTGKSLMILPLVKLELGDRTSEQDYVRVWGGATNLMWDGQTWQGVGSLGQIEAVKADARGALHGLSLTLNGIPQDLLQDVKSVGYRGRLGRVWIAAFDDAMSLIDRPVLIFAGEISAMILKDGRTNRSVGVELESRISVLKRVMPALRTDEDHQRRYPGDKFYEFVPNVLNKTLYWGLKSPSTARSVGGGFGGSYGRGSSGYPFLEQF